MATREQLEKALLNADAAGDTEAAKMLVQEIIKMRDQPAFEAPEPPPGVNIHTQGMGIETPEQQRDIILQREAEKRATGAGGLQRLAPALQGLGWQAGDEVVGGLAAGMSKLRGSPNTFADEYEANRRAVEELNRREHEARPGLSFGTELAGSVASGVAAPMIAPIRGAGTGAKIGNAAITGAAYGVPVGALAAQPGSRGQGAVIGGAGGAALGGAGQAAISAGSAALRPITSRIKPKDAIQSYMAGLLKKSGKSVDDITGEMTAAGREGQGDVFMLADALGHPGKRAASAIARTPNTGREALIEALHKRQAGQSRRVGTHLAEAFDASKTAKATEETLKAARKKAADVAYAAARADAKAVNVAGPVSKIDEIMGVDPISMNAADFAEDSTERLLSRYRKRLQTDKSSRTDFSKVLDVKIDIGDDISAAVRQGKGGKAGRLSEIRDALDSALEESSSLYRAANDEYAKASKVIDAVKVGSTAAKRGRADDNIAEFAKLNPEQQAAYRAGYADPLLGKTEGQAYTSNAARPLLNEAFEREAAAVAGPKSGKLRRQLQREMDMFDTRHAATGGSATAENLADTAEFSKFDPTVAGALFSGNFLQAGKAAMTRTLSEFGGMPPKVAAEVAGKLKTTSSDAARMALVKALRESGRIDQNQAAMVRALLASGAAGAAVGNR